MSRGAAPADWGRSPVFTFCSDGDCFGSGHGDTTPDYVTLRRDISHWHCDMWHVMCDVKIWWQGCSIWRKLENSVANIFVLHQVCSLKINICFYSSRWDVMLFHYFGLHNFLVLLTKAFHDNALTFDYWSEPNWYFMILWIFNCCDETELSNRR